MSIITIKECPLCGSLEIKKVFDAVDHFASKETFPVCDCEGCGFRFTNKFPSEESIGIYYDSPSYISHSDSKEGIVNRLYHLFRDIMLNKKINLIDNYAIRHQDNRISRLLDIGCGTGYFLNAATKRGYTVVGIEKNDQVREDAVTTFGLDVRDETQLMQFKNVNFDVVTLWHSIEHIENFNQTIEKIGEILSPDGVVIMAMPNHLSYDAKIYREFWAAYDLPRHLWHFTPKTARRLLELHQFEIIKQIAMPLDAFYISLLSESYIGTGRGLKYIKAFLVGITGYVRSLFNIQNSGSIIYIAKKIGSSTS